MSDANRFDVIVVGGGIAGLSSGTRAAELGLRVAVLEKGETPQYACNARYSGGVFHVASMSSQEPREKLYAALMAKTEGTADPALARVLADEAGPTMAWLRGHGAKFVKGAKLENFALMAAPPRMWVRRSNWWDTWSGRGPDMLLRLLTARMTQLGGALRLATHARRLIIADGRCIGVEIDEQRFTASAVVLADGGFQGDRGLMQAHVAPSPDGVKARNTQTAIGDGLRMAREAGAALTGLGDFYGHLLSRDAFHNKYVWPYPLLDDLATHGIAVDATGRRFADEGYGGIYVANVIASQPDPLSATVIFDAATWNGVARARRISANPQLANARATLFAADDIATLAGKARLPADALVASVAAYNDALRAGALATLTPPRSTDKHKPAPIVTAPFYAVPACAGITYTMGGIRIDGDARVLRPDGAAIPGLYAAGSTTGGLEGGGRAYHIGGLARAAVFGKRAADHIAALLQPAAHAAE